MHILTAGLLFHIMEVFREVFLGRCSRHAFEHAVEIGDAIEPAIVCHSGNTVVLAGGKPLASLVYPHLVEKGNKGNACMLFEVSAKSLWSEVSFGSYLFQGQRVSVMLKDIIVNVAHSHPLPIRYVLFAERRKMLGLGIHPAECPQKVEKMQHLVHTVGCFEFQNVFGN